MSTCGDLNQNNFNFDPNLILGDFFDQNESPLSHNEVIDRLNRSLSIPGVIPDISQGIPLFPDYNVYNFFSQLGLTIPQYQQPVEPPKIETTPQKTPKEPQKPPAKKSPFKPEKKEIKTPVIPKRPTKSEDLSLKPTKQLPELKKLYFDGIDHQTISHCLQTVEFIGAFGEDLKLDLQISLHDFIQAFNHSPDSMELIIQLFMSLLRLVLPLDTTNRYYRSINTLFKYSSKHCCVTWHNCSELFNYLISLGDPGNEEIKDMRTRLSSCWLFALSSRQIAWAFVYIVQLLEVSPKIAELVDSAFEDITLMRRHQVKAQKESKLRTKGDGDKTSEEDSSCSQDTQNSIKKRAPKMNKCVDVKKEMGKLNRRIRCPFLGHDRYFRKYFVLHSSRVVLAESSEIRAKNWLHFIPNEFRDAWFTLEDIDSFKSLNQTLNHSGIREGLLESSINKHYAMIIGLLPAKSTLSQLPPKSSATFNFSRHCYYELWKWLEDLKLSICDCTQPETSPIEESLSEEDDESSLLGKCKDRLISLKVSIDPKILLAPMSNSSDIINHEIHLRWRSMVESATSSSFLAILAEFLRDSIAWDRIYNKLVCQICQEGENEQLLLICDVCNHGFHSYCTKPVLEVIPEGDWFCPQCRNKQGVSPGEDCCFVCGENGSKCDSFGGKAGIGGELITCVTCGIGVHVECVPGKMTRFSCSKWQCRGCELKSGTEAEEESPKKKRRPRSKGIKKSLIPPEVVEYFSNMISSLECFEECDPFLTPVDCRRVPDYRKVIDFPMDFSTISKKLRGRRYETVEDVAADFRLIFDNCEKYNEDNSFIGECGFFMRRKFEEIWSSGPYCKSQ